MLTYLFSVTLAWGFFALLYHLLLRRETFFHANRAFLLTSLALGLTLPVAGMFFRPALAFTFEPVTAVLPDLTISLQQAEQAAGQGSWTTYLWWMYLAGTALVTMRIAWGIFRLSRMAAGGATEYLPDGCRLIRTPDATLPFSFFNRIYVPVDFTADNDFQNMLAHERAHVHGWHSVDVLLLEILCMVFWFHPLAHWYRRSLRTVHEYLADREASGQTDRKAYGMLLLRQAQPRYALALAHHFFQSPLKQRLLMLTRSHSPLVRSWKYSLVLPIVVFSLVYLPRPNRPGMPDESATTTQSPSFPGGMPALSAYLAGAITYPAAARENKVEGKVLIELTLDASGAITRVQPALQQPMPASAYRQEMIGEAIRVMEQMPDWIPAQRADMPVKTKITLPIHFKLE
ncbi:MAG: TonB family protein [Bacteroidetes bacterium]|nr:MAG: TonB family protein [Bacteroidota bacterium]